MIHPVRRRDWINLTLILIIAAALRFNNLGVSEFAYDEATLSSSAQHIVSGQDIPLLGMISSARIPNFATGDYLISIFYALSSSPLFVISTIALLNVISIGLFWLLVHRYFDPHIAVIAALAYAVSPWALLYSRRIWAPDFVAPFVIIGLLLGFYGYVESKRWAQLFSVPVFILALQLNFAAWALLPLLAWLIWIGRKRIFWPSLIVGALIAALTIMPFIVGLSQIQTLQHLQNSGASLSLVDRTLPFTHTFWLITGLGLETWNRLPPRADLIAQIPALSFLALMLLVAMGCGMLVFWRRSRSVAVLIFLWAFLPTFALLFSAESQVHYYASSIPAYCLLIGAGVAALAYSRRITIGLRALVLGGLGLILLTQVVNWRIFLQFVDTNYSSPQGFHTPIHYFLDIGAHLKKDVVLFPSNSLDGSATLWSPLLYRQANCLRAAVLAEGGIAVLPRGGFSLLRASGGTPPDETTELVSYQSHEQITFPLRSGEGTYTLEQVEQPPVWIGPTLNSIEAVHFDNGVLLTGYTFAAQRLYLDWTLPSASPYNYQYFAHLLNASGDKVAQHDASFWPGQYWCTNDRVVTWIDLNRPPDAVTLRVGMYRLENSQIGGSNAIDSAGNAIAPWIDIPLTTN